MAWSSQILYNWSTNQLTPLLTDLQISHTTFWSWPFFYFLNQKFEIHFRCNHNHHELFLYFTNRQLISLETIQQDSLFRSDHRPITFLLLRDTVVHNVPHSDKSPLLWLVSRASDYRSFPRPVVLVVQQVFAHHRYIANRFFTTSSLIDPLFFDKRHKALIPDTFIKLDRLTKSHERIICRGGSTS